MPNRGKFNKSDHLKERKRRWQTTSTAGGKSAKRGYHKPTSDSTPSVKPLEDPHTSTSSEYTYGEGSTRGQHNYKRCQKPNWRGYRRRNHQSRESNVRDYHHDPRPRSNSRNRSKSTTSTLAKANAASEHGETESSNSECDIPGFYYDPDKKRYFKILPSHNNVNVVTRESVARKTAEDKRIHDLEQQSSGASSAELCGLLYGDAKPQRRKSHNFVHLWHGAQQGDVSKAVIESFVLKTQVVNLKPSKSVKIFRNPSGIYENLEHMLMMESSPDFCDIMGLWSIRNSLIHRLQLLHVNAKKSERGIQSRAGLDIDVKPCGNVVLQSLNKITSVCWAPSVENPNRKYILYTTMCYTGSSPSLALLRNLEPGGEGDFRATDFCLGRHVTWTCAWNPHYNRFSVGLEKSAVLLDVETRKLWELFSNKSDVLAQTFEKTTGQHLFSGTRKGEILTHDLRSRSTYPVNCLHQRSPISCLKLLQNEVYLLASDFKGQINLWDLRNRKPVMEFIGHNNQYSRLPMHFEPSEQILYTVGEDCYTRFWSLKTGELLKTIPPPCTTSRDTVPRVLYSQNWGGVWRQTGMLMGLKDQFHFYDSSFKNTD